MKEDQKLVYLTKALKKKLREYAFIKNISQSEVVRQALEFFFTHKI